MKVRCSKNIKSIHLHHFFRCNNLRDTEGDMFTTLNLKSNFHASRSITNIPIEYFLKAIIYRSFIIVMFSLFWRKVYDIRNCTNCILLYRNVFKGGARFLCLVEKRLKRFRIVWFYERVIRWTSWERSKLRVRDALITIN